MIELVLGGARSGKSRYDENQAEQSCKQVFYIATAEARDGEMLSRIKKHQNSRPQNWRTIEEPVFLAETINRLNETDRCILVDCLTLWLSNILYDHQGNLQLDVFEQQTEALFMALNSFSGSLFLVSNEVGQGVVPLNKMSRHFVDEAGILHQQIAALSDRVVFLTAGIPQILKA